MNKVSQTASMSGAGASLTVVVVWLLDKLDFAVSPEVAAALAMLIATVAHWVNNYLERRQFLLLPKSKPEPGSPASQGATGSIGAAHLALPLLLLAALSLSACGTFGNDAQGNAGITEANIETALDPKGEPYLSKAHFIDGKNKRKVKMAIEGPKGWKVTYEADGVTGQAAIEARARVDQAISSDVKAVAPAIVDTVMGAFIGGPIP